MRRDNVRITTIVFLFTVFVVLSDLIFKTGKEPLFIVMAISVYILNLNLNRLTSVHNKVWKVKMNNYIEKVNAAPAGRRKSIQDKVYGDLTFTITEGWVLYSVFLGASLNGFLIPSKMINPVEAMIVYFLVYFGVMLDYNESKHPRKIFIGILLCFVTAIVSLKILGLDLFIILTKALYA